MYSSNPLVNKQKSHTWRCIDVAVLGGIEGSSQLVSYAFRMVSGSLSDKIGKRKIFVLAGYTLSTISKPFFALTTGWLDAFFVRADDRTGKGLRTAPRNALIADSISESNSGKTFGIHMTIDQTGAIVGPIAAFALLQVMDIRGIFLVSLVPSAIFTEGGNSLYAYVLAAVFWNLCRDFRDIAKGSSTKICFIGSVWNSIWNI